MQDDYTPWGQRFYKKIGDASMDYNAQINNYVPAAFPLDSVIEARDWGEQNETGGLPEARQIYVVRVHEKFCSCGQWKDYLDLCAHAWCPQSP